jgi:hypothetical protein
VVLWNNSTAYKATSSTAFARCPLRLPAKKRTLNGNSKLRDGQTRIAQVVQRLDRMGEIEEADGVCAETKIEELGFRPD